MCESTYFLLKIIMLPNLGENARKKYVEMAHQLQAESFFFFGRLFLYPPRDAHINHIT